MENSTANWTIGEKWCIIGMQCKNKGGGSLLESNDLQWVGEDIEHRALSFFSPYTPVERKVFLWYYKKNNMIIRFLLVARKGNAYG